MDPLESVGLFFNKLVINVDMLYKGVGENG